MTLTKTNTTVKVLSPTLHLYYYVLRNGLNERPETLNIRRQSFNDNLQKLTSHLTSSTGKSIVHFIFIKLPLLSNKKRTSLLSLLT